MFWEGHLNFRDAHFALIGGWDSKLHLLPNEATPLKIELTSWHKIDIWVKFQDLMHTRQGCAICHQMDPKETNLDSNEQRQLVSTRHVKPNGV